MKMRINQYSYLFILFLIGTLILLPGISLFSKIVFSGIVINEETGQPLDNATIRIRELKLTLPAKEDGSFSINITKPDMYNIEISSIGFKTFLQTIDISEKDSSIRYFRLTPYSVTTPTVIVTAKSYSSKFEEIQERTSTLAGKDLQKDMGATLAATLKNETGISIRSMGPAPARPVIRGLSGNRITISEDGIEVKDLSASSPDHAVTIEPSTLEKIEVFRGPKALLFNSSTIGGVVNVVHHSIPISLPENVNFSAGLYGESANRGYSGSLSGEIPLNPFVLKGEFSYKSSQNLRTPLGVLQNSGYTNMNYSTAISYVNDSTIGGLSFSEFSSDYGIPGGFIGGHPKGINIELFKRNINAKSVIHFHQGFVDNIEMNLNRTYYHHKEFESNNSIGAEFVSTDYFGNILINQNKLALFENGSFGLNFAYKDMQMGGYVFTPPTTSYYCSPVIYENITFDHLFIQFGLRYDFTKFIPETGNPISKIGLIIPREFNTFSLAVSGMYEVWRHHFLGLNLSKSSRAPSSEELYSEGPHLAAYSFETGNPALKAEYGYGTELFFYQKRDNAYLMLTGYLYEMPSYILPRNTGQINYSQLLPIFSTSNEYVRIKGFEIQGDFFLTKYLSFDASFSYTNGTIVHTDSPMPMIPPFKALFDIKYFSKQFNCGLRTEIASAQNRVDRFEQPTEGYVVFGLYSQYSFMIGKMSNNISFSIDNLTNTVYRNHLSRIKSIVPESERNFKFVYKVYL